MSAQQDTIRTDHSAAQRPLVIIATALISAVTTIGAAFLTTGYTSPPLPRKLLIGGTVTDLKANRPINQAEVYLIPMHKNPKLISKTNPSGEFTFPDMPEQQYWIVVRDPLSGTASAGIMDEDQTEATLAETLVKYRVQK